MIAIFAVRFIYCPRRFERWPLNLERQVHTNFGSRQMRSISDTMVWISFSPANLKSSIPSKSPEAWAISDQAARWVSWRLHIWPCAWLFTGKGCWLLLLQISSFRRDLNIVYVLLGISPASMYNMPTSAYHTLTPGKYPKEHIQWLLLVSTFANKFVLKPLISRYLRTIWTIYVNLLLYGPVVLRFVLTL